jgi:hypothetical protein
MPEVPAKSLYVKRLCSSKELSVALIKIIYKNSLLEKFQECCILVNV